MIICSRFTLTSSREIAGMKGRRLLEGMIYLAFVVMQ